jgi:hypothetical protein
MESILTLTTPIEFKGHEIAQLVFKPIKVKHMQEMDKHTGDIAKSIALMSSLTGVAIDAIKELSAEDFLSAQKIVGEMLGKSQATS